MAKKPGLASRGLSRSPLVDIALVVILVAAIGGAAWLLVKFKNQQDDAAAAARVIPLFKFSDTFESKRNSADVEIDTTTYPKNEAHAQPVRASTSTASQAVCPEPPTEPSKVDQAVGGFDRVLGKRIVFINLHGAWPALLSPLGAGSDTNRIRFWYSWAVWHELGHVFQSDTKGNPSSPLFALCLPDGTPNRSGPLFRETNADFFALAGVLKQEEADPLNWPVLPDVRKALIAERETESADHRTDRYLKCVRLAELSGSKPEEVLALQALYLAIKRRKADPDCKAFAPQAGNPEPDPIKNVVTAQ